MDEMDQKIGDRRMPARVYMYNGNVVLHNYFSTIGFYGAGLKTRLQPVGARCLLNEFKDICSSKPV